MKRLINALGLTIVIVMVSSCFAELYYEPEIKPAYFNTVIPAEGGDYYFWAGYEMVQTRFQPPRVFRPFRFRVDLGAQTGEVYVIGSVETLWSRLASWPAGLERPESSDYYPVYFKVPANDASTDRAVKVMESIDRNYSDAKEHDWEPWYQVWEGMQNCKK